MRTLKHFGFNRREVSFPKFSEPIQKRFHRISFRGADAIMASHTSSGMPPGSPASSPVMSLSTLGIQ
jgi:hypothetical protein